MNTTIPVDQETENRLFKLKNRIENEEGHPINYTELIQILIRNMERNYIPKHLSEFRQFQGILPASVNEVFQQEREIDQKAEERYVNEKPKHRK